MINSAQVFSHWIGVFIFAILPYFQSIPSYAGIVLNFDSINAVGADTGIGGAQLDSYLSSFGLSLTNVTAGTKVAVYDERVLNRAIAPSPFNLIAQGGLNAAVSFTLQSNQTLNSISVTRPGLIAGATGFALPLWNMQALDANGLVLATVGEQQQSIFSDIGQQVFSINSPNIRAIRFNHNGFNFAGYSSMPLDNLTINPVTAVPEPSSIVLMSLAGLCGLTYRRFTATRPARRPNTRTN